MRKSKFTEEQIASIVTQAQAGMPIDDLCRKFGSSLQTFYRWRSKFAGLTPSEFRRMKDLEKENRRRKRVVADLTLDKQILQDVLRKTD